MESRKKIRVFNLWGGVFWVRSDLDSGKNFILGGGVFWVRSDLDSGKKIRVFNFWRGCILGKVRFGI